MVTINNEKFYKIEEYPNYYISETGKVYSLKRNIILKNVLNDKGYYFIQMGRKNFPIHRLVAKQFLIKDEKYKIINHKNGIKTDNNIDNLEWCSSAYNNQHAILLGLRKKFDNVKKGEDNHSSKYKNSDINIIRNLYNKNILSNRQIIKTFNIHKVSFYLIVKYKSWKSIPYEDLDYKEIIEYVKEFNYGRIFYEVVENNYNGM